MRLRLFAAAGIALAAALAVPVPAHAAAASCTGLPRHANLPVVDSANAMNPERMAFLTGDLMRFTMTSDVAIVAATVRNLGGDDIASYARRLFDCWGVGDADSDRGVLILVAMSERRVRVEIGRGLVHDIDRAELDRAVAAMTAPLRAGDVAGALRAAAVEVATAVGATLPNLEQFVSSKGEAGGDDFGIPDSLIPGGIPGDAPPNDVFDDQTPGLDNPFRHSPVGGTWIPKVVIGLIVFGIVGTFARAALRGGLRLAGAGQTVWRGGFPQFGGGRGWSDPALLQGGHWSQPSSGMGGSSAGSAPLASSGGSSGSSSFGGGSSGGGGASGSW